VNDPIQLIPPGGASSSRSVGGGLPTQSLNETADGRSFKSVMLDELREVNRLQQEASNAVEDLQTGTRDDVDQVILATEKADMAFQMLLQVRNKVMDAYNEVKQIRV